MHGWLSELKWATRSLARRPGFTAAGALTLAAGLGLNLTIFAIVNQLLFEPLPYRDSERLVQLSETFPDMEGVDLSIPDFAFWREETTAFETMGAFDDARVLVGGVEAERIEAAVITVGVFEALAVEPIEGRLFRPEEDRPGGEPVALVSYELWHRQFGADPTLVGKTIVVNGRARTIVGIMPAGFAFPEYAELWLPVAQDPQSADANQYSYDAVARMRDGVTLEEASAEANLIASRLAERFPQTKRGLGAIVYPLRSADIGDDVAIAAALLLLAVSFVLLIACVNVAGLLIARAVGRDVETGIRLALAGGLRGVLRQIAAESFVLATLGSAAALLACAWGVDAIVAAVPVQLPFWLDFELDSRVLAFVAIATVVVTLLCSLAPAVRVWRASPGVFLGASGRSSGRASAQWWLRVPTVAQIALALVLLLGTGLVVKSLMLLSRVPVGARVDGVMTLRYALPAFQFETREAVTTFHSELLARLEAIPGVSSAAHATRLPAGREEVDVVVFEPEGFPATSERLPVAFINVVSPGFFETLSVPMVAGTGLSSGLESTVVVSESLARRFWPSGDALGSRIRVGRAGSRSGSVPDEQPWLRVVGIAADVRYGPLRSGRLMTLYQTQEQLPSRAAYVLLRSDGRDDTSLVRSARAAFSELGRGVPVFDVRTLAAHVASSLWVERFLSSLLSLFSTLALLLAAVGLYGTLAFAVGQRVQEIGIRMAMGASANEIFRLFLRQGAAVVMAGIVLGLPGALVASRLMASRVYGIGEQDAATLILVLMVLGLSGFIAVYLPARRASRQAPAEALRAR